MGMMYSTASHIDSANMHAVQERERELYKAEKKANVIVQSPFDREGGREGGKITRDDTALPTQRSATYGEALCLFFRCKT